MKSKTPKSLNPRILVLTAALAVAPAAWADHNSIWGEGWANMPNDRHDTRIDTLGDNEAFRDSLETMGSMRPDVDNLRADVADRPVVSAGSRP